MLDDPTKTGAEHRTVSDQEHELTYLKNKFHVQFPGIRSNEIEAAIQAAYQESNEREKVESRVREILEAASR